MQDTGRSIPKPVNPNVHGIGQGEARNGKKLGGGQAYDRSAG
jgi:hypothetical protein